MTPVGLWPVAYARLARQSRWRVAVPFSLIVAGLLVVIAGGVYLFAERAAYDRLQSRLQRLAFAARYVGEPGGYLVFDERDHLLSTSPPAISDVGERFQIVPDPVWGVLAVLRLPVTTVGPHIVAFPMGDEVRALAAVRRTLIGMTAAGALAALVAGHLLALLALQPVDDAMRERHEFIALASHQLRTPLSIIRTSVELGRAGLGVTAEEALETVAHQTLRMETLAARLTELAKAESSARPATGAADVVAVAVDVVASLRPAASLAGVALHLDAPPSQWIRAEPAETDDMLTAVVENAIKFSPRGGAVIMRVRLEHGHAVVEVSDQGPGITAEDVPHVARPFFQGRSARGGYGLGLAIARAVAERHGGQLLIVSVPGQGTTMRLVLPVHRRISVSKLSPESRRIPQGSPPT
jgi:signal transduction histidine kinase